MTDRYLDLVSEGPLKAAAGRLGLPRPVRLRRFAHGYDLPTAPILVLGEAEGADASAELLLGWHLEVRRHTVPGEQLGAVIAHLEEAAHPSDLAPVVRDLSTALRQLGPGGRIIVVSRSAESAEQPVIAATRSAILGLMRSTAHETRNGSTANGIVLAEEISASSVPVVGALRFLLSAKSAYVNGQPLRISRAAGQLPEDFTAPLAGRTAIVTGAARGIGAEIARTLHRDGARVVGVDVLPSSEALAAVMNEIGGIAVHADITQPEAAEKIAQAAKGPIDILVNNAGITRDKLLANMKPEQWDQVISVNLISQLDLNARLLESGAMSDAPRIVGLASTSGIAGNRGQTNYAASKAGVIGLTRSSAALLERHGGTINAVAPGFIETEMTKAIPPVTREVARRLSSLQQGGLPVDVAEAVAFFASPQAGGITGEVLRVCGQNLVGA